MKFIGYIIIPWTKISHLEDDTTSLKVNHSIWNTPLRYSNDTILAAFQPGFCLIRVYENLDDALKDEEIEGAKYSQPIFEVELKNSTVFENAFDAGLNQEASYTLTSPENISHIASAYHAGTIYNLVSEWNQREQFYIESKKLIEIYDNTADRTDLKIHINNLHKTVMSFQGKLSYSELTEVLKETNEFLNACSLTKDAQTGQYLSISDFQDYYPLAKYRDSAKTKQGSPSLFMQVLGVCMLILALAVGMVFGITPIVPFFALISFGLFAVGKNESGISKAMNDLAYGRSCR